MIVSHSRAHLRTRPQLVSRFYNFQALLNHRANACSYYFKVYNGKIKMASIGPKQWGAHNFPKN
jgi:hypothetical protein